MDENAKTDAPESASVQSEATPTAPTEPSKREKQLDADLKKIDAELKKVSKERDGYKKDLETANSRLETVTKERNDFEKAYNGAEADAKRYLEALNALDEADRQKTAAAHAEVIALLKRNGLSKAWVMTDGSTCFDENHAKHVAGADFDSLTVITAAE